MRETSIAPLAAGSGGIRREQLGPGLADDRHILEVEKTGAGIEPVRLEGQHHALLQREVAAARLMFDRLRSEALSPADSLALIERVGDELYGT